MGKTYCRHPLKVGIRGTTSPSKPRFERSSWMCHQRLQEWPNEMELGRQRQNDGWTERGCWMAKG